MARGPPRLALDPVRRTRAATAVDLSGCKPLDGRGGISGQFSWTLVGLASQRGAHPASFASGRQGSMVREGFRGRANSGGAGSSDTCLRNQPPHWSDPPLGPGHSADRPPPRKPSLDPLRRTAAEGNGPVASAGSGAAPRAAQEAVSDAASRQCVMGRPADGQSARGVDSKAAARNGSVVSWRGKISASNALNVLISARVRVYKGKNCRPYENIAFGSL
jgi:hypothetical protein